MRNVIVVGSGCAGNTAALYTARANLRPLVVAGHEPGGQLSLTTLVENFPGFPEGILGPHLIQEMRKQAERFETHFVTGDVSRVDLSRNPFRVVIDGEHEMLSQTLIIAAGAHAKLLGLKSESALMGHGVSACATCDGFFFKEKDVLVVGGGDTALEEANFLSKFAKRVRVVHRRDRLRASKIMQDRAQRNGKIGFIWDSVVEEILDVGAGQVTGARLKNLKTGERSQTPTDGVFIAIGHSPNTQIFSGQLDLDERGYILTRQGTTATSVPGVFAAGDVQDPRYRQAITAAGSGCMAAMDAEKFLEEHH